jgi:hypothetical protein
MPSFSHSGPAVRNGISECRGWAPKFVAKCANAHRDKNLRLSGPEIPAETAYLSSVSRPSAQRTSHGLRRFVSDQFCTILSRFTLSKLSRLREAPTVRSVLTHRSSSTPFVSVSTLNTTTPKRVRVQRNFDWPSTSYPDRRLLAAFSPPISVIIVGVSDVQGCTVRSA